MWKRFIAWLLPDWEPIYVYHAIWVLQDDLWGTEEKDARYEIQYSKQLDKYRLECYGYNPYNHGRYSKIVEYYNKFYRNKKGDS